MHAPTVLAVLASLAGGFRVARKRDDSSKARVEKTTITGTLYADNWVTLYINGKEVIEDPFSSTPHNAMNLSFEVPCGEKVTYAMHLWDHMDDNRGLEYENKLIGDAGLRFFFSDGTVSNKDWMCVNVHFGPIDPKCCGYSSYEEVKEMAKNEGLAGYPLCLKPPGGNPQTTPAHPKADTCNSKDVNLEKVPFNWTLPEFDPVKWGWEPAWEYAEDDGYIDFGVSPVWNEATGECGCDTCGEDRNGLWVKMPREQCVDFNDVDWGSVPFIWTQWPAFDNRVYCRYTAPAPC